MVTSNGDNKRIIRDVIVKDDIIALFKKMGLSKGMMVYVQSNLLEKTHVSGDQQTIIDALQEVIGFEGTIICDAFALLKDPACRQDFCYERDLYDEIRSDIQPFHKKRSRVNNSFAQQLLLNDAVYRSNHPTHSCLAWGKYAKLICDKHPLHFPLSKESYLEKIIQMHAFVLLLGIPFETCTLFKYSASIGMSLPIYTVCSPTQATQKEWVQFLDYQYEISGIEDVEKIMEEKEVVKSAHIGGSECFFFSAKEASTQALHVFHIKNN